MAKAKYHDGTNYVLIGSDAEKIDYNNTISELLAANVQGAIDELEEDKADKSNVIEKNNTTAFTPTSNYHPSTKKYVDDGVSDREPKNSNIQSHISSTSNPHSVGKSDVGLSNVNNIKITAGTSDPTGGSSGDIYLQYE